MTSPARLNAAQELLLETRVRALEIQVATNTAAIIDHTRKIGGIARQLNGSLQDEVQAALTTIVPGLLGRIVTLENKSEREHLEASIRARVIKVMAEEEAKKAQ